MYDIIIKAVFGLIRILGNIFTPLIQNIANRLNIPNTINFAQFFSSLTDFIYYIAEGGKFLKRFLLIPNGILGAFFIWITAKMAIFVVVRAIKFTIRIYNLIKF